MGLPNDLPLSRLFIIAIPRSMHVLTLPGEELGKVLMASRGLSLVG